MFRTEMTTERKIKHKSWDDARASCKDISEREQLGRAIEDGWTPLELSEYARSCHRRPGKDIATLGAYRKAIRYFRSGVAQEWRKHFRAQGSKPLPPSVPKDLKWPPGKYGIDDESPLWPFHPEGFVEIITQRARAYFGLKETLEIHPNTWSTSCRAYWREQAKNERLARKAARGTKCTLVESHTTTAV